MKKITFIILIIVLGLSSCEKEKIEGKIKNDPEFAQELRESPENISIGNNNLVLTTYLWRDFMPIAEENGSKMMCVNKLTEVDSIPILTSIVLKKQYVIKGNEIWTAEYSEIRNSIDFILEGVVNLLEETSSISFGPNATSNIGNNSSYVDGIISKTGENAFNFATGDGIYWGPISISSAVSSRTITANYNYEQTPIVNWNTGYMCNDDERLDHVSGMEYWLLESSVNGGIQPDVTLYWADDALSDIQNHASLRVAHWGGSCWANKGGSAMVDAISGVGYITSTKPFTHYSPITFGTIDKTNELPVELIDFDVSCGNNNRIVSWTTASEINNDYFIVERSTNGIIYENIGKKAGSGNSNIINEYIFVDDSNISGDMYYRITQIDFDGTSKTYNAQIINCDESGENITIRPNPFNEVLEIVAHIDDICKIEIYNTLSKLIYSEVSHIRGAKKLQLGDLQNGVYMLRISTKNGKTFNYKIIKH